MQGSESGTVLIVDDEHDVAEVYALRIGGEYETRTAYGGEEALEVIDEEVDVVLLDRRMPEVSGDDVLEQIREDGFDCRVIMLTAVDPGLDIVEMDFDDYLCKPIEKADLVAAIDQQLHVQRYDDRLSEYLEVSSKLALLEAELPSGTADHNEKIEELRTRATELKAELNATMEEFEDIDAAFRNVARYQN